MAVSTSLIKKLRIETAAPILDCKKALENCHGNVDEAIEWLHEQGLSRAAGKAGRAAREGIVDSYIHHGNRIGVMAEVNCETDFVARTEEFRSLAHDLALQVAAMSPVYVSRDEVPAGSDLNPEEVCLLQQPFIKDPSITIQDLIKENVGKLGENIRIGRFSRFSLL